MQLEVNNNHKKINFNMVKDPIRRFSIGALGTIFGISIYGGALINTAHASNNEDDPITMSDTIVDDLPEDVRSFVLRQLRKDNEANIFEDELYNINFLIIKVYEDTDLSFLKHFPNLESILIDSFSSDMSFLNDLKGCRNLGKIELYNCSSLGVLDKDSLDFLHSLNLESLGLNSFYLYPGCEECLNNVKDLSIGFGKFDIDFSKLSSLRSLDLSNIKPYDLAIYFTSDDYNTLINNGVVINFDSDNDKNMFLDANEKLDSIIQSLDAEKDSSDQEKLDAVLMYVLEHLEYDETISEEFRTGGYENVTGTEEFYKNGNLYGALEKNSAICGNYAALVEALLNRLDLKDKSCFVKNEIHAWNVVNINGETYLVDATWLDSQTYSMSKQSTKTLADGQISIDITFDEYSALDLLKSGDTHSLKWYMERLDDGHIDEMDSNNSHSDAFIPEYVFSDTEEENVTEILDNDIDYNNIEDIGDKKVKIKIGSREIIIGVGALVGVLSSIGLAVCVSKKKKENRRRKMHGIYGSGAYNYDYSDFNPYDYGKLK